MITKSEEFNLEHEKVIGTIEKYYKNFEISFELRSSEKPITKFSIIGTYFLMHPEDFYSF